MSGFLKKKEEHLKFRYAVYIVISFVLLLWVVKALELASGNSYAKFGILPRTLKGTIGIFTGPMIHGDLVHLISNTLPFIVLGVMLFYFYHKIAIEIFIWIYLVTGFWIWLLARNAYHIGVSGVVYGMASFLFFSGVIRKSRQLMTVSAIIIFLYGGMLYGIFPEYVDSNISWEAHLLGGAAGLVLAFLFRGSKSEFEKDSTYPEEEEDSGYFSTPNISGDVDIRYSYKDREES